MQWTNGPVYIGATMNTTDQAPAPCPHCGAAATGRFCAECGTTLTTRPCAACSVELVPGARFCHLCGAPQGHQVRGSVPAAVLVAGGIVVVIAVAVLGVMQLDESPNTPGAVVPSAPVAAAPTPDVPPDISTLTPRQSADRLFNRIMEAAEGGDLERATFFRPMALQAYGMLGSLDADARYHVGLIHALTNDSESARAQLDSLRAESPSHLLGTMLAYTIANADDDEPGRNAAFRAFLESFEREIAIQRNEYNDHRTAIDAFRQQAASAVGQP